VRIVFSLSVSRFGLVLPPFVGGNDVVPPLSVVDASETGGKSLACVAIDILSDCLTEINDLSRLITLALACATEFISKVLSVLHRYHVAVIGRFMTAAENA